MNKRLLPKLILSLIGAALAASALYSVCARRITVDTMDGLRYYTLSRSDLKADYADSYLFNNLFASATEDVLRLTTIRAEMERGGIYDADKEIDVTAYVYRDRAGLPNDYITAVYRLGDLLQWGQSGFAYENRTFDARESANFLSPETTYTHILTGSLTSGQSAFFLSQIEQNVATTKESANETPAAGTYRILRNRFRTVRNENVEDLVSDWSDYAALTANIEAAATSLYRDYVEYTTDFAYYNAADTNLRYYVSRPVGATHEQYTNFTLPDLPAEAETSEEDLTRSDSGEEGEDTPHHALADLLPYLVNTAFPDAVRFVAYSASGQFFETNTYLTPNTMRSILEDYRYSFPDNADIFLMIDTASMTIDDSFLRAGQDYDAMKGTSFSFDILPVLFGLLYAASLLFLLFRTLRAGKETKSVRRFILPSELSLLLLLLICALSIYAIVMLTFSTALLDTRTALAALLGFVASVAFLSALFDLIDRIRTHTFVSESAIARISKRAGSITMTRRDIMNVFLTVLLPVIVLFAVNILFPLWFSYRALPYVLLLDTVALFLILLQSLGRERIRSGISRIAAGAFDEKISEKRLFGSYLEMARGVNALSKSIEEAIGVSLRDERLKADLITNVSHDIKTPLTSIINYVDLLKRENIEDETIREYIRVLDEKSARLKQLTIDLVEASKISSGSITVEPVELNLTELCRQMIGEYYEKFEERSLKVVFAPESEAMMICTDPRHLMRIIENLLNNVCKYAMENTRVYFDLNAPDPEEVSLSIKNVSASELNFDASELTERFIRGDLSRSSEGAGLGLSIAESLTRHLNGRFDIRLDGDLFKVTVTFPAAAAADTETHS